MTKFAAYDADGAPLAGLAPTWVIAMTYGAGFIIPQPAITDIGGGLYLIAADFLESSIGIVDLGETASPRYLHIGATELSTFAAYGDDLAPLAGLAPVWATYVDAAGAPTAAPTIEEAGFGTYSIGLTGTPPSGGESGIIDLGATATPRYLSFYVPATSEDSEPSTPVIAPLATDRGGVGFLLRPSTAALFGLTEISSQVFAVDEASNSGDLGDDPESVPPLLMPTIVESMTGYGRSFGDGYGMHATEEVAGSLRLTRDVTARAFIEYPISAAADGDIGTILARGVRGLLAERMLFGVEIQRVDAVTARLLARWEEIGGVAAPVVGATFIPAEGAFSVAVARTWISTTEVELLYVVNDVLIGSETVAAGNIGDGVGGTLTIGCAGDGAGGYERFLPEGTIIDHLSIETDAMCFEELRQDYRRIAVHQPSGYAILRSYIPPGESWSKEPDSNVQKWIAAEGDTLGYAIAITEAMREDTLPDRAYGADLEHWEKLVKPASQPGATIQTRRNNVIGGIRKTVGHSLPEIQTALAPIVGLGESDIELIEFSGLREDDFSVDDVDQPEPSNLWRTHFGEGTVAVAGGICTVTAPIGANVQPHQLGGRPVFREAALAAMQDGTTERATIVATVDPSGLGATDEGTLCGLMMRDVRGNAVFFGFQNATGAVVFMRLGHMAVDGGVITGRAGLVSTSAAATLYMRNLGDGLYECGRVVDGALNVLSSAVLGPVDPKWAGFGIFGEFEATTAAQSADFTNLRIHEPNNPRGYGWLAYRDPALPGAYDLEQAQRQIDKQGPAHGIGVACDQQKGLRLGDAGRLGVDPLFPRTP